MHDNPEQWRCHIIQFHVNDMMASHNSTEKKGIHDSAESEAAATYFKGHMDKVNEDRF